MKKFNLKSFLFFLLLIPLVGKSYIPIKSHGKPTAFKSNKKLTSFSSECAQAKSQTELNVNNVRARLQGGGDLWWDLKGTGSYVVPNVKGTIAITSIFAAANWIAGKDIDGNIKTACNLYRGASNNDWWPGVLDDSGIVTPDECNNWDKHFTVYKKEIELFQEEYKKAKKDANGLVTDATFLNKIPKNILGWPSKNNPYFEKINGFSLPASKNLAFYWDKNSDNKYDPMAGDYPTLNSKLKTNCNELPDQFSWWVFNDAGGVHSSSKGSPMRVQVEATSFAYATDDDLNNMTFMDYKFTNKSSNSYYDAYFGIFSDIDLGCYDDDYIGCDTTPDYMGNKRTMMYAYNMDNIDGTGGACVGGTYPYKKIPMIGIDIVKFPDSSASNVPCASTFMYFLRSDLQTSNPATTDPSTVFDHYQFMKAIWKDGTPLSKGGSGYTQNPLPQNITRYAFSDDPNDPTGWSMQNVKLKVLDQRTVMSAGSFHFPIGSVKNITYSVPWVANQGGGAVDLTSLRRASTAGRELFNRCFFLSGPSAPEVNIVPFDKSIAFNLLNTSKDNARFEGNYSEQPYLLPTKYASEKYKFEGYKIYQVTDENISNEEIETNTLKSRLVAQSDVQNGVKMIYNFNAQKDPNDLSFPSFIPQLMSKSNDTGINRSFLIKEDAFATGTDKSMVNGEKYFYKIVAYGYNNYVPFDKLTGNGQQRQYVPDYLPPTVVAIPESQKSNSISFNDEFPIVRYDGVGTNGTFLDMEGSVYSKILAKTFDGKIPYKKGFAPVKIIVIDPSKVTNAEFEIRFKDDKMDDFILEKEAIWQLFIKGQNVPIAEGGIASLNEQIISKYGILISIAQQKSPGSNLDLNNGFIGGTIQYSKNEPWYKAAYDELDFTGSPQVYDFIKNKPTQDLVSIDPNQAASTKVLDGFFVPYSICDYRVVTFGTATPPTISPYVTPAWHNNSNSNYYGTALTATGFSKLRNIDIVLTSDKSKWSRCVVLETSNSMYESAGLESEKATGKMGKSFDARAGKSIGTDTDPNADSDGTTGKSWFPGYAVDVENGERLNIVFGENSGFDPDNKTLVEGYKYKEKPTGRDMIWNPTSDLEVEGNFPGPKTMANFVVGCGHFIYVLDAEYDGCKDLATTIGTSSFNRNVAKKILWTSMPYTSKAGQFLSYKDGLIPNNCIIKLRVNKPYNVYKGFGTNNFHPSYAFETKMGTVATYEVKNEVEKFNVFPNPLGQNNALTLSNIPVNCDVSVYSLDGKLCFHKVLKDNLEKTYLIGNQYFSTSGVYLVVVKSAEGIQSKKVVVQSN